MMVLYEHNATLLVPVKDNVPSINPVTGEPEFTSTVVEVAVSLEQDEDYQRFQLPGVDTDRTYLTGRVYEEKDNALLTSAIRATRQCRIRIIVDSTRDVVVEGDFELIPVPKSRLGLESIFGHRIEGFLSGNIKVEHRVNSEISFTVQLPSNNDVLSGIVGEPTYRLSGTVELGDNTDVSTGLIEVLTIYEVSGNIGLPNSTDNSTGVVSEVVTYQLLGTVSLPNSIDTSTGIVGEVFYQLSGTVELPSNNDTNTGIVEVPIYQVLGTLTIPNNNDVATGIVETVIYEASGNVELPNNTDTITGIVEPVLYEVTGSVNVSDNTDTSTGVVKDVVSSFSISSPMNNQLAQYEEFIDAGLLKIKGVYEPTSLDIDVEVKLGGADWVTIGSATGGVIDLETEVSVGQEELIIRPVGDADNQVVKSGIGAGEILWLIGDSMMSGRTNESATIRYDKTALSPDRQYDLVFLNDINTITVYDPDGSNPEKYIDIAIGSSNEESDNNARKNHFERVAEKLVEEYSRPVMLCNIAKGGTKASDWVGSSRYSLSLGYFQGLNTKVRCVCMHLGTNEVLQSIPATTFNTNLLTLVSNIKTDYQVPVLIPVLQQVPADESLAGEVRQVIVNRIADNPDIYSGGDMSAIAPETPGEGGDNIHFKTDATALPVADIWFDALREFIGGSVRLSGTVELPNNTDTITGIVVVSMAYQVSSTVELPDSTDTSTGVVMEPVSTLFNGQIAAWYLNDTTTTQDSSGNNYHLTQVGTNVVFTSEGADFATNLDPTNPTHFSLSRVGTELDFSNRSFTVAFIVKIKTNTSDSSGDENYFRIWDFSNGSAGVMSIDRKSVDGFRLFATPPGSGSIGYQNWADSNGDQPFYRPPLDTEIAVVMRYYQSPREMRIDLYDISDPTITINVSDTGNSWSNGVSDNTTDPLIIGFWTPGSSSSSVRQVRSIMRNVIIWDRTLTNDECVEYCTFPGITGPPIYQISGTTELPNNTDLITGVVEESTAYQVMGIVNIPNNDDGVTGIVVEPISTLFDGQLAAWYLTDATTTQDSSGNNYHLTQVGNNVVFTSEGADFATNLDPTNPTYFSLSRVGTELDFSNKSVTIAFTVKIRTNTSSTDGDENYFRIWDFSNGSAGVVTIDRKRADGFRLFATPLGGGAIGYQSWADSNGDQPFYRPPLDTEIAVVMRYYQSPQQMRIDVYDVSDPSITRSESDTGGSWSNGLSDNITDDLIIGFWTPGTSSAAVRQVRSIMRNVIIWDRALTDDECIEYCTFSGVAPPPIYQLSGTTELPNNTDLITGVVEEPIIHQMLGTVELPNNTDLVTAIVEVPTYQLSGTVNLPNNTDLITGIVEESIAYQISGTVELPSNTDLTTAVVEKLPYDVLGTVGLPSNTDLVTAVAEEPLIYQLSGTVELPDNTDLVTAVVVEPVSTLFNGQIAAWYLNDTTTTQDSSGNGYHLTQVGTNVTYTSEGADLTSNLDPTNPTHFTLDRVGTDLTFSNRSFTIAFIVKIKTNTSSSSGDENYFRVWDFSNGSPGVITVDRKRADGFRLFATPPGSGAIGYGNWADSNGDQPFYRPPLDTEIAIVVRYDLSQGELRIDAYDVNDTSTTRNFSSTSSVWSSGPSDNITDPLIIGFWNSGTSSSAVRQIRSVMRNIIIWDRALTNDECIEYCTFNF